MRALVAGAGACIRGSGTVLASFGKACYLSFDGELVALVGPGVHPGPVHLVIDAPPPRLEAGTAAAVEGGWLLAGACAVALAGARPWRGALPDPQRFRESAPLLAAAAGEAARGSRLPGSGRSALAAATLEEAAGGLAGLGPGLTPSGDDVLAGALLALRAAGGPAVEGRMSALVESLPCGRVSRAFLWWAARGQSIAPAHDLLMAAAAGDAAGAAAAAAALVEVGESSGADLALGLAWGAGVAGVGSPFANGSRGRSRLGALVIRRAPPVPRGLSPLPSGRRR